MPLTTPSASVNRAQLIDDAFNLALVGKLHYTSVLDLVSYLKQESDYIAWVPAFRGFDYLNKMLAHSKEYSIFKKFVAQQLQNVTETIGLESADVDEDHLVKLARVNIVRWGCTAGVNATVQYAERKLNEYLTKSEYVDLHPDLKVHLLCGGLRKASQEQWEQVLDIYMSSNDSNEQQLLLGALACTESKEILANYAEMIFNTSIAIKNIDTAFGSVIANTLNGVEVGLNILATRAEDIRQLDGGANKLQKYFTDLGNRITSIEHQSEFGRLAIELGIPKEVSGQALQSTYKNRYWMDKNEKTIATYLTKFDENDKGGKDESRNTGGGAGSITATTFLILLPVLLNRLL